MRNLQLFEQQFQLFLDPLACECLAGFGVILQFQHRLNVVLDAQAPEYRGILGQIGQAQVGALVDGQGGNVAPVNFNSTEIGRHQPYDHVKTGGFAGAIGTQQTDNFAAGHGNGDVLDNAATIVYFLQANGLELPQTVNGIGLQARAG